MNEKKIVLLETECIKTQFQQKFSTHAIFHITVTLIATREI